MFPFAFIVLFMSQGHGIFTNMQIFVTNQLRK